jgi:hypothetical protein
MAKSNKTPAAAPGAAPPDHAPLPVGGDDGAVERRLQILEKGVNEAYKAVWDGHKWFVSIALGVGVVFSMILAFMARQDTKEASARVERETTRLQQQFQAEGDKLEKRFAALAGDALKAPVLEAVSSNGVPITGATNVLTEGLGAPSYYFEPILLRNTGDRRTDPISVTLYIQFPCRLWDDSLWAAGRSVRPEFRTAIYVKSALTTIATEQSYTLPDISFQPVTPEGVNFELAVNDAVPCELEIFYGG